MKLTVHVKLISPTMLGGSNPKSLDSLNWLRPTSIRGMLHFWFRAVMPISKTQKLLEEEKTFFGGTEEGSKLKILPPIMQDNLKDRFELFPHKDMVYFNALPQKLKDKLTKGGNIPVKKVVERMASKAEMILPGESTTQLTFLGSELANANADKLKAILWLWLHLGSIGKRSRRGYGSLLWAPPKNGDLLSDDFEPFDEEKCEGPQSVRNYLMSHLPTAIKLLGISSFSGGMTDRKLFRLESVDQIFVGKLLKNSSGALAQFVNKKGEMQYLIHGLDYDERPKDVATGASTAKTQEQEELGGRGGNRLASPMLWRLYPCQGGFVPVMTWSPKYVTKLTPGTNMYDYLSNTLGFKKSLLGNPL